MIKNYSLFLLFFIVYAYCQKVYQFNFLTKYDVRNFKTTNIWQSDHYSNSEDGGYFMVISYPNTKNIKARLVDFQERLIHRFTVKEKTRKKETYYEFEYENSSRIPEGSSPYDYSFKVNEDGSFALKYHSAARHKALRYDVDLDMQPLEQNLFGMFSQSAFHPYRQSDEIQYEDSYIVNKATMRWDGYTCNFKLNSYKSVALEVNVPQELVFFKDNFSQFRKQF